jgi:hypothetical protein
LTFVPGSEPEPQVLSGWVAAGHDVRARLLIAARKRYLTEFANPAFARYLVLGRVPRPSAHTLIAIAEAIGREDPDISRLTRNLIVRELAPVGTASRP